MITAQVLNISIALLFVTLMQLLSNFVAVRMKKPGLSVLSSAILAGVAAGCGVYPIMPIGDAWWLSALTGAVIGTSNLYLTNKIRSS